MSASPLLLPNPLSGPQSRTPLSLPALAGVVLVHAALLAWMLAGDSKPEPLVVPPMTGILVSPASSAGGAPHAGQQDAQKAAPPKPEKRTPSPAPREKAAAAPVSRPFPAPAVSPGGESKSGTPAPGDTAGGRTGGTSGTRGSGPFFSPRVDAAHLNNPRPKYPAASRRMAEEGTVTLSVHILSNGSVEQVRLKKSSGYPRLDQAAIDAVRQWRYIPARRGDTPIDYWYTQAVKFSLTD